jgi:hypothetical protein
MPTAFAKPVEPQASVGPDNDPKPQIPPIKDPWGYKGKMLLDEDNLALNNEPCNIIGGHVNKGLEKALRTSALTLKRL